MTTLRNDASFPGADNDPWPTVYNPSVTTTGVANILAGGLRGSTGNTGGQLDFVRGILDDAAVNGVADIGVLSQFDFSSSATPPDCSLRFHLRASNDWAGASGARPGTFVRLNWASTGDVRIEHVLANGTLRTDQITSVALTPGISCKIRFEVQGNEVRAKAWINTVQEPTTGGVDNDGFILKATMSTDIVTAGGRFSVALVGPTTAGATNGYARIRNVLLYDFGTVTPPTPTPTDFIVAAPRHRGRRR